MAKFATDAAVVGEADPSQHDLRATMVRPATWLQRAEAHGGRVKVLVARRVGRQRRTRAEGGRRELLEFAVERETNVHARERPQTERGEARAVEWRRVARDQVTCRAVRRRGRARDGL